MSKVANSSKHIAVLRSALKKIKAKAPENYDPNSAAKLDEHMFYLICNRRIKKIILHVDMKSGKTTAAVKNPKAIQIHLNKVFSDKNDTALKLLLEINTALSDTLLKKLVSCAGQVTMANGIMDFTITDKAGKGTAEDLRKALNLSELRKFLPPPANITINGAALGGAVAGDNAEAPDPAEASGALDTFLSAKPAPSGDDIEAKMEELGLSVGDLIELSPLPEAIQAYVDSVNADFDYWDSGEFERDDSVFAFVSELTRDAWTHNLRDVESMKADSDVLDNKIAALQARIDAGEAVGEATIEYKGRPYTLEKIEDLRYGIDEAMLILDYGTPDEIEKRFYSIDYKYQQEVEGKIKKMSNILYNHAAIESVMADGDTHVELENGELVYFDKNNKKVERPELHERDVVSPIPAGLSNEEKLMLIKMMTDKNFSKITELCKAITDDPKLEGCSAGASRKAAQTIVEKSERDDFRAGKESWIGVEHVRDTFRFKAVVDNIEQIPDVFHKILRQGIELIKIDTQKFLNPKGFGWRIIAFDLRMPYNNQIVEWYLPLKELEKQKKSGGHQIFEDWRGIKEEDMTPQEKIDYKAAQELSTEGYNAAFDRDVIRMGYKKVDPESGEEVADHQALEVAWKTVVQRIEKMSAHFLLARQVDG